MIWYLGLSTALWFVISYLTYRSGYGSGYEQGYKLGRERLKDTYALHLANSRYAGKMEAWREINDVIDEMCQSDQEMQYLIDAKRHTH